MTLRIAGMTFNQRPFQLKVDLRKWTIANIVHHRNLQTLSRTTLFRTVSETIEHLEACVFSKNNSLSVLISRLESGNLSMKLDFADPGRGHKSYEPTRNFK